MSDPSQSNGGFFGNLFGGGGSSGNPQQDQLYRYMMAQQLMKGMQPNFSPTPSTMGAMGQAASPLINALMMWRMGQGGGNNTPWDPSQHITPMTPGQQGVGGFVAPQAPSGFLGPNIQPSSMPPPAPTPNPMAVPPTPAAAAAPVAPVGAGAVGGLATPAVNPGQGFVDSGAWAF